MKKTKHASPDRVSTEEIRMDYETIIKLENVKEILDALPNIAVILNPERQLVYSNRILMNMLKINEIEHILGTRPGETISCIHSREEEGGCGTSESCRYCGAVNTILQSQKENKKTSNECRIKSVINGEEVNFDLLVTSTPFYLKDKQYIILSLHDISSEKRRKALERIFFHDVLNTAGGLNGIIELMKDMESAEEIKDILSMAGIASKDLMEEIMAHRELVAAENNEIKVKNTIFSSHDLINDLINQIKHNSLAGDKIIILGKSSENIILTSDEILLRRVLRNMLKNAIEATEQNGTVYIGCFGDENTITFWVKNSACIPRDSQLQIFNRSFSTKGLDRGLGTYSMKLLTEKYLKGKISFTSDKENGTIFRIQLTK